VRVTSDRVAGAVTLSHRLEAEETTELSSRKMAARRAFAFSTVFITGVGYRGPVRVTLSGWYTSRLTGVHVARLLLKILKPVPRHYTGLWDPNIWDGIGGGMGMLVAPTIIWDLFAHGSICTWIYLPHLVRVASIRSTEDPSEASPIPSESIPYYVCMHLGARRTGASSQPS
jgi:hypothetical protein